VSDGLRSLGHGLVVLLVCERGVVRVSLVPGNEGVDGVANRELSEGCGGRAGQVAAAYTALPQVGRGRRVELEFDPFAHGGEVTGVQRQRGSDLSEGG
jgi:hypothetical protein